MTEPVQAVSEGGVRVLTLEDPPINGLGPAMRQALWEAFDTLPDTDTAVVLIGAGACFCGGADLRALDPAPGRPTFADLMDKIEACDRPVIAAMHGRATGLGLALALACHARVTAQGTRLGHPEVTLGFPPGGGATQRLPRLIGVAQALNLALSGALIPDSRAIGMGLVDARATGDLRSFAVDHARALAAAGHPIRRTARLRDALRDGAENQRQIAQARARIAGSSLAAPKRIIDCIEAALLLPFAAGVAFEQTAFEDAFASAQSKALRHMALADRTALQMPEAKSMTPRPVQRIALLGQGKRALDLATVLLQAGLDVTLAGTSDMALVDHVGTWFARAAKAGRLNDDQVHRALQRLRGPVPPEALTGVDLVIDTATDPAQGHGALPPDPDRLLAVARDGIDLGKLDHPAGAAALGFGVPAVKNPLWVLGAGPATQTETLLSLAHLIHRLGKQSVICTDARIDLTARMLATWRMAAETCLRDGATPYQIDAAMRAIGCTRGPFQLLDLVGLNSVAARLPPRKAPRHAMPDLINALRADGRLGRRAGKGTYLYDDTDPAGREDPDVQGLITRLRAAKDLPERDISNGAIQRRCVIALANEAAYLRAAGIVRQASDLDVVMHHGLGFPRWRGGPVRLADEMGLLGVRRDLQRLADHDPFIWQPAPLLSDLIKNGTTLSEA